MKIAKNTFIYLGAEVLNKSIPFFLIPIITRYLSPSEYGKYGLFQVFLSIGTAIIGMNLEVNIIRYFFKVSKDELSRIVSSTILILGLNFVMYLCIILSVSVVFKQLMGIRTSLLIFIPILVVLNMLVNFTLTIFRMEERGISYGVMQFFFTLLTFVASLCFLVFLDIGWVSLIIGSLTSSLFFSVISFYFLKKKFKLRITGLSHIRKLYFNTFPLAFHLLGNSAIFFSDRIFIKLMLDFRDVGLYTLANQFASIIMILLNSIVMSASPWFYKSLSKGNTAEAFRKSFLLMAIFGVVGFSVWAVIDNIFPFVVNSRYLASLPIIFWLSLAYIVRGWYQLFYNFLIYGGKTFFISSIGVFVMFLNLVLNYLFIKHSGIKGAAQATLCAFAFQFIAYLLKSLKLFKYL